MLLCHFFKSKNVYLVVNLPLKEIKCKIKMTEI